MRIHMVEKCRQENLFSRSNKRFINDINNKLKKKEWTCLLPLYTRINQYTLSHIFFNMKKIINSILVHGKGKNIYKITITIKGTINLNHHRLDIWKILFDLIEIDSILYTYLHVHRTPKAYSLYTLHSMRYMRIT